MLAGKLSKVFANKTIVYKLVNRIFLTNPRGMMSGLMKDAKEALVLYKCLTWEKKPKKRAAKVFGEKVIFRSSDARV